MNFGYFTLPLTAGTLVYNTPYQQAQLGIGGTGNYIWLNTGAMPPGLVLDPATGVVSGTPTNTGSFNVGMRLNDDAGDFFASSVTFIITSPTGTTVNFGINANLGVNLSPAGQPEPRSPAERRDSSVHRSACRAIASRLCSADGQLAGEQQLAEQLVPRQHDGGHWHVHVHAARHGLGR